MKTEYRKVNDGYLDYLEYKTGGQKKYLFGFIPYTTKVRWKNVPKPYYHPTFGTWISSSSDVYVNSYSHNLERFVKEWVDIEDYLVWANQEQKRLEKVVAEKDKERQAKVGKITNFE
jgi:hypothetical protein